MEWIQADPLPKRCQNCKKKDCYNCDYAGLRWTQERQEELRIKRKMLQKAIERMERQIKAIDKELEQQDPIPR